MLKIREKSFEFLLKKINSKFVRQSIIKIKYIINIYIYNLI